MKQRLCYSCLLPTGECVCPGADHFENDPVKQKLANWGIPDPKRFIAAYIRSHPGQVKVDRHPGRP